MVKLVDPFECSELEGLERTSGSLSGNQPGPEEKIVDRLGQGVVVRISEAIHSSLNAHCRKGLCSRDRNACGLSSLFPFKQRGGTRPSGKGIGSEVFQGN